MTFTHQCFCDLAPLYVIDLLNEAERDWVEQQLTETPELAEELAQYQTAATALPYGTAPLDVDLNPALKGRLFQTLGLAAPEAAPSLVEQPTVNLPPCLTVRFQDIRWRAHPVPKVEVSIFYTDPVARRISGILKAAPGMQYPRHRHAEVEEIYMISGDLRIGNEVYGAGDYIRSQPGSMHNPRSHDGCMFFFNTSMDDEYFKTAKESRVLR